jgi:hypothetical protein
MANLIKMHGIMVYKHILVIVSDGGPDHRVTFGSVQVSSLTLFRALDLDMLICVRKFRTIMFFGDIKERKRKKVQFLKFFNWETNGMFLTIKTTLT